MAEHAAPAWRPRLRQSHWCSPVAVLIAACLGLPAHAGDLAVPVGVKIPVALAQTLNSQTAHVGDTFAFRTTRDETLGTLALPAGTVGHGRIAVAVPAQGKRHGTLALQADTLDAGNGAVVWVDIDTSRPPSGHLSDRHTRIFVLPLPVGIVPAAIRTQSGNLVLDANTPFRVVTTAPRTAPAPLATAWPANPSASAAPQQ